ncbi:MAG: GMP synthase, partial [Proteobacteria bacterium]|nr:GMP synthase [Pseudomonadota bacterium]
MSDKLKVGILQTDSVMDQFVAEHGDYPDMFVRVLSESAPQVSFHTFNVVAGELPEPGDCDGYVITGSRKSVYDEDPWIKELA